MNAKLALTLERTTKTFVSLLKQRNFVAESYKCLINSEQSKMLIVFLGFELSGFKNPDIVKSLLIVAANKAMWKIDDYNQEEEEKGMCYSESLKDLENIELVVGGSDSNAFHDSKYE